MSTSDLRVRIRRRLEGGFDPVIVFRELAAIPSPSFLEYVMYGYLGAHFRKLRAELPAAQQHKLTIGYSSAGQLQVAWRGLPGDRRRTMLVAHVDREGFLVRDVDWKAREATCWHTAGGPPEDHLKGSRVILTVQGKELTGTIADIAEIEGPWSAEHPFNHVVLVRGLEARGNRTNHMIANKYFKGSGNYDVTACDVTDGVIAATNVDNTAGVSVLVTLLSAIARNGWSVNVDCLFTTCEEAGFCGIVNEILDGSTFVSGEQDDVVCIVVDSSSHLDFAPDRGFWTDRFGPAPEEASERVEIPLQDPVVRTGDATGTFDRGVARLLRAAAANLEGAAGPLDWIQPRSAISASDTLRALLDGPRTASAPTRVARRPARLAAWWADGARQPR
jgi:putative aminopeptidase FrvX